MRVEPAPGQLGAELLLEPCEIGLVARELLLDQLPMLEADTPPFHHEHEVRAVAWNDVRVKRGELEKARDVAHLGRLLVDTILVEAIHVTSSLEVSNTAAQREVR